MSHSIDSLIAGYPLISDQIEKDELRIILAQLEGVLNANIPGDVVEFGCYAGTTSLFLTRLLIAKESTKHLYVYDSFDGLPEKSHHDESPLGIDFKRGELRTTKNIFIENFRRAGVPLPHITKKWFHEVEEHELPGSICFAFLDGDYYKSIRASLDLITPRLSQGAIIIVDDYQNEKLPGAKKAVKDWNASGRFVQATKSLGIIKF